MALLEFEELSHAKILVNGVGGGGGNAVNTMIAGNLDGVEFIAANTDVAAIATLVVGLAIKYTIGLRLEADDEVEGIDFVEHGESAYDLCTGGGARRTSVLTP